jgi:hypothetical protein
VLWRFLIVAKSAGIAELNQPKNGNGVVLPPIGTQDLFSNCALHQTPWRIFVVLYYWKSGDVILDACYDPEGS